MTTAELIAGVRRYAVEHYEDGGWDVIVECWEDAQIGDALVRYSRKSGRKRRVRTLAEAVTPGKSILADVVSIFADRQADARNSAF